MLLSIVTVSDNTSFTGAWACCFLLLQCQTIRVSRALGHAVFYCYSVRQYEFHGRLGMLLSIVTVSDNTSFTGAWACCFLLLQCQTIRVSRALGHAAFYCYSVRQYEFHGRLGMLLSIVTVSDNTSFTGAGACCFLLLQCQTIRISRGWGMLLSIVTVSDNTSFTGAWPCCFLLLQCQTKRVPRALGHAAFYCYSVRQYLFHGRLGMLPSIATVSDNTSFTGAGACCFLLLQCQTIRVSRALGHAAFYCYSVRQYEFHGRWGMLLSIVTVSDNTSFTGAGACCFLLLQCQTIRVSRGWGMLLSIVTVSDNTSFTGAWPCCFLLLQCQTKRVPRALGHAAFYCYSVRQYLFHGRLGMLPSIATVSDNTSFTGPWACYFLLLQCQTIRVSRGWGMLPSIATVSDNTSFTGAWACCFLLLQCQTIRVSRGWGMLLTGAGACCFHLREKRRKQSTKSAEEAGIVSHEIESSGNALIHNSDRMRMLKQCCFNVEPAPQTPGTIVNIPRVTLCLIYRIA